jgi:light-regulated signal transduction histidine kinase (bacteriophytochrome)
MPRTAQRIPANETEAQKFVRLANHRVNTIMRSLKQLGQLGSKQYLSTSEQRKKITDALQSALLKAMESMSRGESPQDFKL